MRAIRHLLTLILIAAVLCSGLHHFQRGDLNRDNRLSLEDAILHIKNEALLVGNLSAVITKIKNAHAILQVLAGLKENIKPANEKNLAFYPELTYLLASNAMLTVSDEFSQVSESYLLYQSITIPPASPPPRRA
jgi:hypothetical protein